MQLPVNLKGASTKTENVLSFPSTTREDTAYGPTVKTDIAKWPVYDEQQIEIVSDVLRSGNVNYWTNGLGRAFEESFAEWSGSRYSIALANGTVALQLALGALNLPAGSEVITTPRTFVATASTCILSGLRPVFADVDLDSGNITAESIEAVMTKRTAAIMPVHLGGWPCDMPAIVDLAKSRGVRVIEDCAQAHKAQIHGKSVGTFGDIGSWSFCQDKIITTGGEGGMVTTDDQELWATMWQFKDHGKDLEQLRRNDHPVGYRWLHCHMGTNFRLTEMQSALGMAQLDRVSEWHAMRTANAKYLVERLSGLEAIRIPLPSEDMLHAFYRLYVYINPEALKSGWSRDRILSACTDRGIPKLTVGSCGEVYLEKCVEDTGVRPSERLPNAQKLADTSLAFVVHPGISRIALDQIADVFTYVVSKATA